MHEEAEVVTGDQQIETAVPHSNATFERRRLDVTTYHQEY